jgi:hypothetical protein
VRIADSGMPPVRLQTPINASHRGPWAVLSHASKSLSLDCQSWVAVVAQRVSSIGWHDLLVSVVTFSDFRVLAWVAGCLRVLG